MKELHIPYTLTLSIKAGKDVRLDRDLFVTSQHPLDLTVWPNTQKVAAAYLDGDYQDADSAYLLDRDLEEAMSLDIYRLLHTIRRREKNADLVADNVTGFYTGMTALGCTSIGHMLVQGQRINPKAVIGVNVSITEGAAGEDKPEDEDELAANPEDYYEETPWD